METTTMAPPTSAGTMPLVTANNLGRDQVHWGNEVWDRIDKAVHDEVMRTRIGARFLPIRMVLPKTTSVPSDIVTPPQDESQTQTVDEGATTRINEYWVEFALTPQQVEQENLPTGELGHSTAVTLATRAANFLSQAEDLVIFQGVNAFSSPFFKANVRFRGQPSDTGLLDLAPGTPPLPASQVIPVPLKSAGVAGVYGENTFAAVAKGYANLQANGQYGTYALVLQTTPYADTYAPLPNTLILTADRLTPLMTAGFWGSGTLVANAKGKFAFTGVLVSLGGNTMDLVVGIDATTAFMQQDTDGAYRFRVLERFALRLKDITAVVRLEFQ